MNLRVLGAQIVVKPVAVVAGIVAAFADQPDITVRGKERSAEKGDGTEK